MRFLIVLALALAPAAAFAQADIGLVNLVSGEVGFTPQAGAAGKAKAFMKVREGDRFEVPAGAQLRVVYFDGARQERWQGPASFRATRLEGAAISGKPAEVATLPASVSQRIARVPELVQNAKLGGIQVRAAQPRRAQDGVLQEARSTYEQLRKALPPDDITPELFLYSALNEYQLYEDMRPLVQEMLRKQPGNDEVKSLGTWLNSRLGR
jgi:hypothetical protein